MKNNLENVKDAETQPTWMIFIFLGGILLPLITLGVEFVTHLCGENFFDPIPTLWHVLFVAFVPLSNVYLFHAVLKGKTERATLLGWSSAITIAITFFYSILFTPLLPISIITVLIGFGFLSLSPFFALIATLLLRRNFLKIAPNKEPFPFTWRGLGAGLAIFFVLVLLAELPFAITRYGLEMAKSQSIEERERGVDFLRKYGNENYLLRQTYWQKGVTASDFLIRGYYNFELTDSTEENRKIFYLVKGKTFNEVPRPRFVSDFDWNEDSVSGRESERDRAIRKNITLESSAIDGTIDSDAMLGYVEWTLEFKNSASWQEEAFAQIQLPKDAVVSRLTLWIGGEEREAAFAERRRVQEAYQKVVSKRRDPVLVTTAGRDLVNMRCFPIEPNGGTMKLRIGITFPLQLENETNGIAHLPHFQDRNFVINENKKHQVWYESKKPLEVNNKKYLAEKENDHFAVRGDLTNGELQEPQAAIRTTKSEEIETIWTKDKTENSDEIFTQKIVEIKTEKPSKYVFVVDTSLAMKEKKAEIAAAIENLPKDLEIGLILTNGNALNREIASPNAHWGKPSEIAKIIKQANFGGGTDNLPALDSGWNLASKNGNGAVFWLHAPQPLVFDTSTSTFSQNFKRRPNQTEIFNIQLSEGLDKIEAELFEGEYLQSVQRFGTLKDDLSRLISNLNQTKKSFGFEREKITAKDFSALNQTNETSDHLARLWAFDEIKKLVETQEQNPENEQKAVDLAMKYQLVTPVSGAVVLETKQQYDEAGLKPVDKQSVPTIPEPETYLLIAIVGLFLLFILFGKRLRFVSLRT